MIVTKIIISLGSNTLPEQHIEQAVGFLKQTFGEVWLTRRMWTKPIGMKSSSRFLNMLVLAYTPWSLQRVEDELKRIERFCGRKPEDKMNERVVIDVDLLLYGNERCHLNDWQRDYVDLLMTELKNTAHVAMSGVY